MKKPSFVKTFPLLTALFAALLCAGAEMPPCPLTDAQAEDLLKSLSPECRALAPVFSALEKKDLASAKHLAAEYFRKREEALPPVSDPSDIPNADRTVKGVIREASITHTFPDGVIDWKFNPTKAPGKSFDPEWQWQLNRMHFWNYLSNAYSATHDETYARTFVSHLRTWAAAWPRPQNRANNVNSGWRTIECGIRLLGSWSHAFRRMANSSSMTDDDVLLFLYCSREQVRHIMKYRTSGNWLTMEMNGAYSFAADNPEFSESKSVRETALKALSEDIVRQFLPDGAQYELSPGYHMVALENSCDLVKKADNKGFGKEVPPEFREILTRAAEYAVKIMTPDRSHPKFNDDWEYKTFLLDLRRRASNLPSKPVQWAVKGAKPGKDEPDFTSLFLPYAGIAVFRSGWETDANVLYFDVGPLGKAHCHQDKLHLILFGYGEELLFDDGGGHYEKSATRNYAKSSRDHSTVVIDGAEQNNRQNMVSKPIDGHFTIDSKAESAWGDYLHKGENGTVIHRRQVLWIKPDLYLVCDRLLPKDGKEHHYEARWQVDSRKMEELLPGSGILRSLRGGNATADLIVAPLSEGSEVTRVSGKKSEPMGGLYVGRNPRPCRPAVTVSHTRSGKGTQTFLTLLQPVRKANSATIRSVTRSGSKAVKVEFSDGRTLTVTVPEDPQKLPVWQLTQMSKLTADR